MKIEHEPVLDTLHETQAVMFGEFTLKSGLKSPIYIDLRKIRSFPSQKLGIVRAYEDMLIPILALKDPEQYYVLADIPTSITPIVSTLTDRTGYPQITPRIDQKEHGSGASIDGVWKPGSIAIVIGDLITTAKSKLEAIEILEAHEIKVENILVLIDRQQGGKEELEQRGYKLHSYSTMSNLIEYYSRVGLITPEQFETTMEYLGIK